MNWIHPIKSYAKYLWKSDNAHGIHSPFVFALYNDVIADQTPYYIYGPIESARAKLLLTDKEIQVTDYGAGSRVHQSDRRKVSAIARHSLNPKKYAQLLFRLVNYFHPQQILELGTSLGITTAYLAAPHRDARVHTIEGCPTISRYADHVFQSLHMSNIEAYTGPFGEQLPPLLEQMKCIDLAFIDGHHTEKATLDYFEQCLPYIHDQSVIVFDDIHWSPGMERAWRSVQQHPKVSIAIDLFHMGIVFFESRNQKEHFTLRF